MDRLSGKIAVVTGASSGIGAATAIELALTGFLVIGLARRTKLIDNLNKYLINSANCGEIYSYYCDVTNVESIESAFNWIDREFGQINVLVNAAGIARYNFILGNANCTNSELENVIDTNLLGSIYTTRTAYKIIQRNNNYAHVFLINSVLGHAVPEIREMLGLFNSYPASKFGITATAQVLRQELKALGNKKVKITSISPGLVETNIAIKAGMPNAKEFLKKTDHLQPKDIANSILYALGTPPNVLIQELTITSIGE